MSHPHTDSMEFSNTLAVRSNVGRSAPNHLLATQILHRHNVPLVHHLTILNTQGKLSTYTLMPLLKFDPYATGANAVRTIWIGVSENRNQSLTARQEQVYRNTAIGMVELFNTPKLGGQSNPYNALVITNAELRDVHLPSSLLAEENQKFNNAFDALMKRCAEIEATISDETVAAEQIKKVYDQYLAFKAAHITNGTLTRSQILLTEEVLPVAALNQFMNSSNPFLNFASICAQYKVSYAPTVNSVNGFITTTQDAAPEGSDLNLGRRNLDQGKNPRSETSVMATATDQFGSPSQVIARVIDPAYAMRNPEQATRSEIFEEIISKPSALFVQGSLNAFVAKTGSKGLINGTVVFGVNIENYTQQQQVLNPHLNANSLGGTTNEDFNSFNFDTEVMNDIEETPIAVESLTKDPIEIEPSRDAMI